MSAEGFHQIFDLRVVPHRAVDFRRTDGLIGSFCSSEILGTGCASGPKYGAARKSRKKDVAPSEVQ